MTRLAWLPTTVRAKRLRTPNSISLLLENTIGEYLAGQHVDVRLVAEDGYEARRSYSIASAPGNSELELLIERLPNGEVSPFIADELQSGETLEIRGPIGGHFTWTPDRRPIALIAGGSGIAPLMSMVRHRSAAADPASPALLLYSARNWSHMAFAAELESLAAIDMTFSFVAATTREPARRPGDFDRRIDMEMLTAVLESWGGDRRELACFICGANEFVETAATALVKLGMPADAVKTERYGSA